MATVDLRIKVTKSNVPEFVNFFRFLSPGSHQLHKAVKAEYEKPSVITPLTVSARTIIKTLVYDTHESNRDRTYNLLNSFLADVNIDGDRNSSLAIYSDPDIAPAKQFPHLSYAAFFEEPSFNTFIPPRGIVSPVNHRPFMNALTQFLKFFNDDYTLQTVTKVIKRHMPKK